MNKYLLYYPSILSPILYAEFDTDEYIIEWKPYQGRPEDILGYPKTEKERQELKERLENIRLGAGAADCRPAPSLKR